MPGPALRNSYGKDSVRAEPGRSARIAADIDHHGGGRLSAVFVRGGGGEPGACAGSVLSVAGGHARELWRPHASNQDVVPAPIPGMALSVR